jgi:large subunit ribosomal protein L2
MLSNKKFKFKPLLYRMKEVTNGRNRQGKIILRSRRISARDKRINIIDWRRNLHNVNGHLYNVNILTSDRNAFVGNISINRFLIYYNTLLSTKFRVSDKMCNFNKKQLIMNNGDSNYLKNFKLGIKIYNISKDFRGKGIYSRSAGTFSVILRTLKVGIKEYVGIKLPSGIKKYIPNIAKACVGRVSNNYIYNLEIGSAGKSFNLGIRPKVRGVAMNPVDHPHGGGEGKTTAGGHPVSLWGKLTKGKKTVLKHRIIR